ncbi:relaxase/mobilization nuclease domain-containing protein [Pseudonocardia lacus]|uniref:relaxase/mobilization nuclease domain-containing protein n=1 Tax=Pseudonocardia lacus TaxID=2835865 RepID=UPI001BDD6037|nr:hypothetical protein [Pseudonocardia lacus]
MRTGPGEWDFELGPLIRALRAPAVAAGLPEDADEAGKRGYVWHCSARVAAGDRVLSDAEWAGVARELLDAAGIAERGDAGGPRWVAIRHADDHIHIAVVLVRQDTARRFWPHRDFPRLREAARRIERRLGLTITAAGDGTAARAPSRGEIEKARRRGRGEPVRVELARAVREAAVLAHDADSFIAALREAGYLAQLRRAPSGDALGYTVGRADDVSASGVPVRYSGSKLAPDLSLPRLMQRWAGAEGEPGRDGLAVALRQVQGARRSVTASRTHRRRDAEDPGQIGHATADVLTALRGWPGTGTAMGEAADLFDRAARPPRGRVGRAGSSSLGLRRAARQLIRQRRVAGEGDLSAVIALAVALVALVREIATWQHERGRGHQSAAASASADLIERWSAGMAGGRGGPGTALMPDHVPVTAQPHGDPVVARASSRPRE